MRGNITNAGQTHNHNPNIHALARGSHNGGSDGDALAESAYFCEEASTAVKRLGLRAAQIVSVRAVLGTRDVRCPDLKVPRGSV